MRKMRTAVVFFGFSLVAALAFAPGAGMGMGKARARVINRTAIMSLNVGTAAFRVGYESPSKFSREYARMLGASPRRDVASLRQLAA